MNGIENGRGIHPRCIGDELGTTRVDLGEFRQVIGLRRDRRARRKMIFPKPMVGEFSLYILYVEIQYCLKCIFHIIVYIYIYTLYIHIKSWLDKR